MKIEDLIQKWEDTLHEYERLALETAYLLDKIQEIKDDTEEFKHLNTEIKIKLAKLDILKQRIDFYKTVLNAIDKGGVLK